MMHWLTWPLRILRLAVWFAGQMVLSSAQATLFIVGIKRLPRPILIRHATACRSHTEVALLSILISLTPGTLVLATRSSGGAAPWRVYVHDMYSTSREDSEAGLARLERHVLRALRVRGVDPRGDAS